MRCFAGCVVAVVMVLAAAGPAGAQQEGRESQIERRVEFNRMVAERDRLHAQLEELDRRAAEQVGRGGDPVRVYAEQMAVQDRLDRLELRLDVLALRHGFTIPPLRGGESGEAAGGAGADTDAGAEVFERGRVRAQRALRSRYERFLASVDFGRFLAELE